MITTTNLGETLISLGFKKNKNKYKKEFKAFKTNLIVDFDNKKLIYPTEIKGGGRNNGFNAPENFV